MLMAANDVLLDKMKPPIATVMVVHCNYLSAANHHCYRRCSSPTLGSAAITVADAAAATATAADDDDRTV